MRSSCSGLKNKENQHTHQNPKNKTFLLEFQDTVDEGLYNKVEKEGPRKGEKYRDDIAFYQSSLDTRPNQRYYVECPDGSLVIPPGKTFPKVKKDGAKAVPVPGDKVWRWSLEDLYQA